MIQSENFPMIAKTMAELEDVLAEELINLGAADVEIGNRMVSFTGNQALMYKANVHCRTALRILKPIYNFKAETADEVYEAIKALDWDQYLSLDQTFSIDSVVFSHIFSHSKFVAYRVKDGIVDWFSERFDKRPSVSVTNPDLVFNIHVAHNKCTLSLDSSGESLHKRGYRVAQTEAPLNEVLAAGMVLKTGWRGESTFIDPMCGSGTLLIEAAMIALGIPPGIHRESFGFEKWNDFDADLFSEVYNDDTTSKEFDFRIIGSDISAKAISVAEKNIRSAGLTKHIDLSVKPIQQYDEAPQPAGVLITNPPYGERIKIEDLDQLYGMIGERLKHVFAGYDAYVLSYKKELFDQIGLRPTRRFFLYNGALECEMRHYEIFEGKRDDFDRSDRSKQALKRERRAEKFSSLERNSREGYRRSRRESASDEPAESGDFTERRGDRSGGDRNRHEFGDRRSGRRFDDRDGSRRFDDRRRERPERTPGERIERAFDKYERGYDDNRKPRQFGKRSFDSDRKFESGGRGPGSRDRKPDFRKDNERSGRDFDRRRNFSEKRNFDKRPQSGRKRISRRRDEQGGSSEQGD